MHAHTDTQEKTFFSPFPRFLSVISPWMPEGWLRLGPVLHLACLLVSAGRVGTQIWTSFHRPQYCLDSPPYRTEKTQTHHTHPINTHTNNEAPWHCPRGHGKSTHTPLHHNRIVIKHNTPHTQNTQTPPTLQPIPTHSFPTHNPPTTCHHLTAQPTLTPNHFNLHTRQKTTPTITETHHSQPGYLHKNYHSLDQTTHTTKSHLYLNPKPKY